MRPSTIVSLFARDPSALGEELPAEIEDLIADALDSISEPPTWPIGPGSKREEDSASEAYFRKDRPNYPEYPESARK